MLNYILHPGLLMTGIVSKLKTQNSERNTAHTHLIASHLTKVPENDNVAP